MQPVAIAIAKDGRIAIADWKRKGVHLFLPDQKKYLFLYKAEKDQEIQSPVSVAFGNMELYVSDSALQKVLVYDRNGTFLKSIDGVGTQPFGRPTGLSFQENGGLLHVADTTRNCIHVFDIDHGHVRSIGSRGAGIGGLNFPTSIALDSRGRLFINDTMNFRVQIYDPGKGFVAAFGRHGDGSGDFAMPKGLAVDRWGVIYVADSLFDAVQLFDQSGHFLLTIGSQGTGAGEFWMPSGLFIDDRDRLYVCDTYNGRIQIFQLYDFTVEADRS